MKYRAIVIGVSSGGLSALKLLLPPLPRNLSMAILVVQHIGADSDGYWIQLLDKLCELHVKEAEEKESILPGTVYIAPPNYHLLVEHDHTLSLSADEKVNYARPAIDVLFETAADAYGESLIGIVLTGSSNDGTAGLLKIRQHGGLTIAQDPSTAISSYMPLSAIRGSHPHYILPLEKIISFLVDLNLKNADAK